MVLDSELDVDDRIEDGTGADNFLDFPVAHAEERGSVVSRNAVLLGWSGRTQIAYRQAPYLTRPPLSPL